MLEISGLHFGYGEREVLRGIDAKLQPGTLCGLFGPNGSGKTTLFKCCLKLLATPAGTVSIDGRDVAGLSAGDMARRVAYVPQEHDSPFPYLVKEIVLMGRTPHMGRGLFEIPEADREAVAGALDAVGIGDLADARYDQLSGGQRQLVLVSRAIAQQTPLIVLDEPTSALDFDNQVRIWRILHRLAMEGTTVLACSHDPNHVAWFCDRVLVLDRGRIVVDGSPEVAITESTIRSLYDEACQVSRINGLPVVIPGFAGSHRMRAPVASRSR
ncbi:MAG: ABC transporter ATP-binding protein [Longimicrobiales bacterium]